MEDKNTMNRTDAVIIQLCLDGNTEVFSILVTKYKRLIYGVAYQIIGNPDETNDLAQEAFLKIFKSLNQYNPKYQFSTWAVKITTNVCLDWKRKQKEQLFSLEDHPEAISSAHTPESEYLQKELTQKIKDSIDELPEKYQKVLILFHQAGLSYKELIEILGEPMTIIKNRLYRARLMLKEKLIYEWKEKVL
jgi:RNA polymerase sigma factor (sigma-70 family)